MARQFSLAVRNATVGAYEAAIGASPTLEIRTGAPPADCDDADSGTVLVSIPLPADWMTAPAAGSIDKNGAWGPVAAAAGGTAGHFRIKQGATCHDQGTVSQRAADGGTGDMKLEQATAVIAAGQQVSVTAMALTAGGA